MRVELGKGQEEEEEAEKHEGCCRKKKGSPVTSGTVGSKVESPEEADSKQVKEHVAEAPPSLREAAFSTGILQDGRVKLWIPEMTSGSLKQLGHLLVCAEALDRWPSDCRFSRTAAGGDAVLTVLGPPNKSSPN